MESWPKISIAYDSLCELLKCGASLEIKEKKGNYNELLGKKSMCHSKKNIFWKDRATKKMNVHKPKNFDRCVATRH